MAVAPGLAWWRGKIKRDHLVPLSLLGAHDRANWVVLAEAHNRWKWDSLTRGTLKWYRHERVQQPLGVRFRDGFVWPVVNGRARYRDRDRF